MMLQAPKIQTGSGMVNNIAGIVFGRGLGNACRRIPLCPMDAV